jgi:uncharacterized protein involved in propanediol utilization
VTDRLDQDELPEDSGAASSPADIASAARSCSVILIILVGVVVFLCVALGVARLL